MNVDFYTYIVSNFIIQHSEHTQINLSSLSLFSYGVQEILFMFHLFKFTALFNQTATKTKQKHQ